MPWTPLESSWAKYHRATSHLHNLDRALGNALGEDGEPARTQSQIEGHDAFLRVLWVANLRDLGLVIGDALNNYRATLDHLVWDLVKLGASPRLTRKEEGMVQYPFGATRRQLRGQRAARMPGVDDRFWRVIEANQPYRRDEHGRALRHLNRLTNLDKHRQIVPTVFALADFRGTVNLTGCTIAEFQPRAPRRSLYVGAKLLPTRVTPIADEFDVQIEGEFIVEPSLGYRVPVQPTVLSIRDVVLDILSQCERML